MRAYPKHLHELLAVEEQCAFFRQRGLTDVYRKRARDYIRTALWDLEQVGEQHPEQKKWLLKQGRRMLRRCRGQGIFDLNKDGWMLVQFFPRRMRIYNLAAVARQKLCRKKGEEKWVSKSK